MSVSDDNGKTEVFTRFRWSFSSSIGAKNNGVLLRPGGKLEHFRQGNETSWEPTQDGFQFLNERREVTCALSWISDAALEGLVTKGALGWRDGLKHRMDRWTPSYPLRVIWSAQADAYVRKHRIYLRNHRQFDGIYRDGNVINFDKPVFIEPEGQVPRGRFVSVGAYSYFANDFHGPIDRVGRYCSIAVGSRVMGDRHPIERVTTHLLSYDRVYFEAVKHYGKTLHQVPYNRNQEGITIGNDVWIGEDVRFAGGISIGNGAVVATRAVVTKDVPPYAIVGGIPARVLRYRFDEGLRNRLIESQWWDYNCVDLPQIWDDPEKFLDALDIMKREGSILPWQPERIEIGMRLIELENEALGMC